MRARSASMEVGRGVFFDVLNPDPKKIDIRRIAHSLAHIYRFSGFPDRGISVCYHSYIASIVAKQLGYDAQKQLESLLHDRPEGLGLLDFIRPLRGLWKSWDEFVAAVNDDTELRSWSGYFQLMALLNAAPDGIKQHLLGYRQIELSLEKVSGEVFGVPTTMSPEIKEIDDRLCLTEKLAFLGKAGIDAPEWAALTSRYKPYRFSWLPRWLDLALRTSCYDDIDQPPITIYYHWFMWPGRAKRLFLNRYKALAS